MNLKQSYPLLVPLLAFTLSSCGGTGDSGVNKTDPTLVGLEALGSKLFFDRNLSNPVGQSCASCHLPSTGFADPDKNLPVSAGAVTGRVGNRNAPTASYSAFIPTFQFNNRANRFEGGLFVDGRADSLEEQAQGPFLNVLEMNHSKAGVISAVQNSDYAADFQAQFGADIFDDVDTAYINVSEAIAEFERGDTLSPFSSKFDAAQSGDYTFTAAESRGQVVFNDRNKGDCRRCHSTNTGTEIFTDFSYRNIGIQRNENNPFYDLDATLNPDGSLFTDLGLGAVINDATHNGRFRVPTLRNIALTAPYMHNGVFNTLEEVINFYNTRDISATQPAAEVATNVDNARNIGELGLSANDMSDLVAFLETLSDGFTP